jgi:hypothetical protein
MSVGDARLYQYDPATGHWNRVSRITGPGIYAAVPT